MAERPDAGSAHELLRFLAAYSLAIYVFGVFVISIPVALAWGFDYYVSEPVRFAVVGASLLVLVLTYVAERRVGFGDGGPMPEERASDYSLETRALLAAAALGVAVGIYAAVEVSYVVAFLFFVGAYLFTRLAFREED